ncbi:MAG: N-acetyltransferase [Magnetococcus sp. YQC-3]
MNTPAAAPFIHPQALCESQSVGAGTRIWAFAHVMAGAEIGAACNVCDHAFIESGARIGDRVTIKNRVLIWSGVVIEEDVFLGPAVTFTNDRHPRSPRMEGVPEVQRRYHSPDTWLQRTLVCRGASIGAGSVIVPGVTIGAYSMVAAGTVVTRDVPPHRLVRGNPGRLLGWVCHCGVPLRAGSGEALLCPACQGSYRVQDGLLTACP